MWENICNEICNNPIRSAVEVHVIPYCYAIFCCLDGLSNSVTVYKRCEKKVLDNGRIYYTSYETLVTYTYIQQMMVLEMVLRFLYVRILSAWFIGHLYVTCFQRFHIRWIVVFSTVKRNIFNCVWNCEVCGSDNFQNENNQGYHIWPQVKCVSWYFYILFSKNYRPIDSWLTTFFHCRVIALEVAEYPVCEVVRHFIYSCLTKYKTSFQLNYSDAYWNIGRCTRRKLQNQQRHNNKLFFSRNLSSTSTHMFTHL